MAVIEGRRIAERLIDVCIENGLTIGEAIDILEGTADYIRSRKKEKILKMDMLPLKRELLEEA